jgi:hypothetical protein
MGLKYIIPKQYVGHHDTLGPYEICYDWCPACRIDAAMKEETK